MIIIKYILLICYCYTLASTARIPVALTNYADKNADNIEFEVKLPNNDVITIELSFNLLKASVPLGDEPSISSTLETTTIATTSTTTSSKVESGDGGAQKFFTVEEAIEAFRQDLILKEKDIAGIIESERPFYRHFKLVYDENSLTIRCTYDSNYQRRTLNIACFEYHEYQAERILANGDVEMILLPSTEGHSDLEIINVKNYQQMYDMVIT